MDYDYDYLGVGNSQHPANQEDSEPIEEKELSIREAFETGHEDLILEAIGRYETKLDAVYSELVLIRDYASEKGYTELKNRIIKLLKKLQ